MSASRIASKPSILACQEITFILLQIVETGPAGSVVMRQRELVLPPRQERLRLILRLELRRMAACQRIHFPDGLKNLIGGIVHRMPSASAKHGSIKYSPAPRRSAQLPLRNHGFVGETHRLKSETNRLMPELGISCDAIHNCAGYAETDCHVRQS